MEKETKDKFYVLQKPTHQILSIVFVGGTFPLTPEIHDGLENLKEISDIIFVFDEKTYKTTKFIRKEKFATLYGSKLWVDSGNFLSGLIGAFEYEAEVFKSHSSIVVMNLWDIDIDKTRAEKIQSICFSQISQPVLKITRPGPEEFFDIYKKSPISLDDIFGVKSCQSNNKYCSYSSTSPLAILRPNTAGLIVSSTKSDEMSGYLESFKLPDFRYFLASVIKYTGIEYLDFNPYDLEI